MSSSSEVEADELREMTAAEKIVMGYSVKKWIMANDLKDRFKAIKEQVAEEENMKTDDGVASMLRKHSSAVEEYWDENDEVIVSSLLMFGELEQQIGVGI